MKLSRSTLTIFLATTSCVRGWLNKRFSKFVDVFKSWRRKNRPSSRCLGKNSLTCLCVLTFPIHLLESHYKYYVNKHMHLICFNVFGWCQKDRILETCLGFVMIFSTSLLERPCSLQSADKQHIGISTPLNILNCLTPRKNSSADRDVFKQIDATALLKSVSKYLDIFWLRIIPFTQNLI